MSAVLDSGPAPAAVPALRRRPGSWGTGLASVALCVLLWHVAATQRLHLGLVTFQNVPTPVAVAAAFGELLQSPKLLRHLGSSLQRIGWGFGLAALLGVSLGLAIGRLGGVRRSLLPPLEVLRPIPAVAWIPLSVLMFPSSEGSMVFITFVGALFPVLLATLHGAEGVDARLLASARSLGCTGWRLFGEVVLPAAAPSIVTGLAIGMGTCWFCLVSAEMISGQFGIGYWTWESYTVQNYANIVVGMLLIGVLGMGSSALLRWLGRRAMPWYRPSGAPP
ncbi:MAG TPA: ABC transporter permease [Burkholderiaceae bacterium]|nr:ABC transporter permease [Burkholderiaceae bacterium]